MEKYEIGSLDAWVWRVAHNRYARFIDSKNKNPVVLLGDSMLWDIPEEAGGNSEDTQHKYEQVFHCLHTLSAQYRNIFVDYYIGEMSVAALSKKYALSASTVKWRLNVGRQRIKDRIGDNQMEKIYQTIRWDTATCNGNMDPDAYLHTQIARAICLAAYEKPLTVEEISVCTGIPAMYIEDELPRLIYGDAISQTGNKYATDFIIFRLRDKAVTEQVSGEIVRAFAEKLAGMLKAAEKPVQGMDFYGSDFGMQRLGHILVPYVLRQKIWAVKKALSFENGPFPPRKDGGYGWYIVREMQEGEDALLGEFDSGNNCAWNSEGAIYYYWVGNTFRGDVYNSTGTRWLCDNGVMQQAAHGILPAGALQEQDAACLVRNNLIEKYKDGYKLTFPCFRAEQFREFAARFDLTDAYLDSLLADWIRTTRQSFASFVPKRLHGQINQWLSCYLGQLTGSVIAQLAEAGVLRKPNGETPLTDGVFYVEGAYQNL